MVLQKYNIWTRPSWVPTTACGRAVGPTDPLRDQAAEWPWLCSFLFQTSQRFGYMGCPMCWELRAFSTVDRALSPLMLPTALLWRCLMGSNPRDSKTGMLVSLPWNNSQLMWWPESTQGTWAALPRGKTSLSYPKWDMFLSKQIGYKSRQMNKYRNMCTFLSKFICCSKCCQKSVSSATNSRRTWGSCF